MDYKCHHHRWIRTGWFGRLIWQRCAVCPAERAVKSYREVTT